MPTLSEQLDNMLAKSSDSDEGKAIRLRAIREVQQSGKAPGLNIGETIPYFELPDSQGHLISSEMLLARGPIVISFYRGDWCAYCNLELKALQAAEASIAAYGASVVAISGQRLERASLLTGKLSLSFPVLSDIEQTVIRAFKLRYEIPAELRSMFQSRGNDISQHNADGSWTLPISATYITDRVGKVVVAHAQADWRVRLSPEEILKALAKL